MSEYATLLLGAYSGYTVAADQKAASDTAAAATYNAEVEQQKAATSTLEAQAAATQQDQQNRRNIATQKAQFASAGVDVGQGTPLDVMSDTATQGELSKQLILYRGKTQTLTAQEQSVLDQNQATTAIQAGDIKAGSSLLSTAASAYGAGA